jgi:hypothetical protein
VAARLLIAYQSGHGSLAPAWIGQKLDADRCCDDGRHEVTGCRPEPSRLAALRLTVRGFPTRPATRSSRASPVAATITCVSRNLVPASPLICTGVSADHEMCGLTAEWVALEGPIYAMVASPRCIAHAVAASQDGNRIRPITAAERATGELAI